MKRILCIILTAVLVLSPTSIAFAKHGDEGKQEQVKNTQRQATEEQNHLNLRIKESKQSFKINGVSVIKYGKYKLPISPVTKGMGATVTFDKATGVLTIVKDTNTIIIDFMNKTVIVNGISDTKSGIFTAKNNKKMTVLVKYAANVLGARVNFGKDKITVTVPGLDLPTAVTITPIGTNVVANTLNSTTVYMTATANIVAGQATGGKAELYVGSKLVATDSTISATDTTVTFTTADATPTNAELQLAVPTGGIVTVKLYNESNQFVLSKKASPALAVDYIAPTVNAVNSAIYSVTGGAITVSVTGASIVADMVDVTKVSFYDTTLTKSYQLTDTVGTGSVGVVKDANTLTITLGSADKIGLAGFGGSTVYLSIVGSLLKDKAGNTSENFVTLQTIPVTVIR